MRGYIVRRERQMKFRAPSRNQLHLLGGLVIAEQISPNRALATYASTYRGEFPSSEHELAALSAVGQYVANAIQLFQHDRRKPLVDVNMARFLERYLRPRRLADIRHDPWLQAACHWLVDCVDPISVNWAVLDQAAMTCRARKPLCGTCIFRRTCSNSKHLI